MKRKTLLAMAVALLCSVGSWAQASYNTTYTDGVTVAAGGDYFLYNISSGMFLTDGMDYGTHASIDHAGRVITLATSGSGYTINSTPFSANGSDAKAGGLFLNGSGEPYVDGGSSAEWTFESVSFAGYSNVYTVRTGDKYLYIQYNDGLYQGKMGAFVRAGDNTGDSKSYWLLIPMSARQAAKDYTYLLRNTDFNHPWELPMWTNDAGWTNIAGGKKENACAEMYGKGFDIYQTISATITNGRYKLYNQGFYNNADGSNQSYLYANKEQSPIAILNAHGEGTSANMAGASDAFTAGHYVNSVEAFVSDGSLKVGIKNATSAGNAWTIMDNFYLEYLGQCVMDYAEELPAGGAMTADKWYYFDIAVAGDNYDATATTLGDIICIDDGYTLTSAVSGTIILTAENNDFAVKRYYVKSSSDNNLVVAPKSFTYDLGSITAQSIAEGEYVKTLTSFVVTYGDAATSDGSASLSIIGTPVATLKKGDATIKTGVLTANNAAKTLTATFSDVELVLNSDDYSITIPAGAFGYEGEATNSAITLNFNTPLFADGAYYMKNKGNSAYLAAGLSWSSQSLTNTIGRVVDIAALPNGKFSIDTHVKNNATDHYLGSNLYCDAALENWTFASDGAGGYTISNGNGYLQANGVGEALNQNASTSAATSWALLTAEAWKTEQVARLEVAAADYGVDATFYIPAANFNRNDTENSKWQGSPGIDGTNTNFNGQKYNTNPFDVYQELTDLEPGVYKVTMQGFYRNGTTDDRNAYLYANDRSVALVNIRSTMIEAQDNDKGFTTANGDYWVPNKQNEAALTFDNNYYNNELYFEVSADGNLRIGVKKETAADGDWAVFDNFKLTYYGPGVTGTIASSGYSTFSTDQALNFTEATGIEAAYVVSNITNTNVSLTMVNELPANSGVILKGTGGDTFIIPSVASAAAPAINKLHAAVTATDITANSAYILKSGEFHLVTEDSQIPARKAYLLAEDVPAAVKALSFIFDEGVTTNINASRVNGVELNGEETIYNIAGQRQSKMQKGINIVNGKKVVIK